MKNMADPKPEHKKTRTVYRLRNQSAFESFIANHDQAVIVAHHYMCPHCETQLKTLKLVAGEYASDNQLGFGKIHIQLQWMIDKAELKGDIEEENVFLRKIDVGDKVPATLFYRNKKLIWKFEGAFDPAVFRGLVEKLLKLKNDR